MALGAGSLRHRVEIRAMGSVQDPDTGIVTEDWIPLSPPEAWAEIKPASVREFIAAGIEQAKISVVVTIRYRPGIKPSMRIYSGERVYNIEGALPDSGSGKEWLVMPCSEVIGG